MLAAVAGALRSHFLAHGYDTEVDLKAMVPVSVRADSERGALGNKVAAVYAPLPIGLEDPIARFRDVHEAMRGLKESGQAVGAETITALADFAPPTILSQAARIQAVQRLFNLTVTNVPGPQFPLYLLGRQLSRLYPLVPIVENAALGIAIMSYNGRIDFGLVSDYDALPDLDDIAAAIEAAIAELAGVAASSGRAAQRASAPQAARLRGSASLAGTLAPLTLALAQLDPRVGDLEGNARLVRENITRAREAGAELVLFPELVLSGYPPEDLLLKEHFLQAVQEALAGLAQETQGIVAMVGYPERADDVYNALAVLSDGAIQAVYRKTRLPNYGVFDEQRYFQAGDDAVVLDLGNARIGLTICEDIWTPGHPAAEAALAGATLIVNASASPYFAGKGRQREAMLVQRARDNLCAIAFCNCVGGQDELVFDGHSVVLDHEGTVLARAPQFEESLILCTVDLQAAATARLRDTRLRPPVRRALPEVRRLGPLDRTPPAGAQARRRRRAAARA